jgi:hypothetical protein
MIATVSPHAGNFEHTLNTLRYADRVKELQPGSRSGSSSSSSYENVDRSNHSRFESSVVLASDPAFSDLDKTPTIKKTTRHDRGGEAAESPLVDRVMQSMAILHDLNEMVSRVTDPDLSEIIYDELTALKAALEHMIK